MDETDKLKFKCSNCGGEKLYQLEQVTEEWRLDEFSIDDDGNIIPEKMELENSNGEYSEIIGYECANCNKEISEKNIKDNLK